MNKYRKAELLREEGEKLFKEKQYEAAMSVLIDAGNLYVRNQSLYTPRRVQNLWCAR